MSTKLNSVILFLLSTIVLLGIVFFLHSEFLAYYEIPKYGNLLALSYAVNALLATTIFVLLYIFRTELKNYIGFLFMAGSFLKFIVFFLLFYPPYKEDGEIDKIEFLAFFVPYLICLLLETVFIARLLKELDKKHP